MKTALKTLGAAIAIGIIGGLLFMYSGVFNVATAWDDPALARWVLNTTRERSVAKRAASIDVPPLGDAQQIEEGFRSYREMCAICHTPPGGADSPTAQGLNPAPPDLAKHAEHMSEAELFWSIKNGIRMTGMPAWGPTHGDNELWNIVAFVKVLPDMNLDEYQRLETQTQKGHSHRGDGHGDETRRDEEGTTGHGEDTQGEAPEHKDDGHAH